MAQLIRKILRAVFNHDPSFCDMHEDAGAHLASEEYLGHIRRHLAERFSNRRLSILDAGCQAGRLLIPLAQDGHRLIGIDTSQFALRRLRAHLRQLTLTARLQCGNIGKIRRWVPPASLDVVVCTEVLYLCRDSEKLLPLLADSLKPGGLLCISHRPTLYYVASALQRGQPEVAASLAARTEGRSPDGEYHNWQTRAQIEELYRSLGLNVLGCYPIRTVNTRLDLSPAVASGVRQLLKECRETDSSFRIPTYLLAIAEKARLQTSDFSEK